MTRTAVTVRLPDATIAQLKQLAASTGMTQTQLIIVAIDRMAKEQKDDRTNTDTR